MGTNHSWKAIIITLCIVAILAILANMYSIGDKNNATKETNSKSQESLPSKTQEEILAEQEQLKQQLELEQKIQVTENLKKRLETEIRLLDEPFSISSYCNLVEDMNYLVTLLNGRAKMIQEGESFDNAEIRSLTKKLQIKAVAYQIKAFPILRKSYTSGLNKELWIVDGKAYTSGNNNIYITIVSPELIQNRMKREAHLKVAKTLKNLRFRQARYKYYDGSDYTFWTVFEGKDADLITY